MADVSQISQVFLAILLIGVMIKYVDVYAKWRAQKLTFANELKRALQRAAEAESTLGGGLSDG